MTIEEQIDEELRENCTLIKDADNVRVWVSKTEKINYDALYEAMISLHKEELKKNNLGLVDGLSDA